MIGPSRSAGAGKDALPRVRRGMSRRFFCCFCGRSLALSELRLFQFTPPVFTIGPSLDVRRRIARERVPTSRKRHRLVKSSNPQGRSEERVEARNAGARPNKRKLVVASLL